MLRLFRTIRKKLIEQDNIRKYLLYAVGEIFLVVVGILIALQVNNWNEDRKNRNAVDQYIASILQDIDSDIEALTDYRDLMIADSIAIAGLQERILAPLATTDTLKQIARYEFLIPVRTMPPLFNPTFQAMSSSGDIKLLNKEAAEMLQRFYADKNELMEVYTVSMTDYGSAVQAYMEDIPTPEAEFVFDFQFINSKQADKIWDNIDEDQLSLSFNRIGLYRSVVSSLNLFTIRPFLQQAKTLQDSLIAQYPNAEKLSE